MEHRKRRVNGLEPPYTAAQLSTWVFLPTMIIEFCAIASPLMPLAASIPVTIVLVALAAAAAYFGYQTMKVDPSDPRSLGHTESAETEQTKQCWICDIQVNTESMHCKFCNKCVDHFDHHCMWLNTCVGKQNYHLFYKTMINIIRLLVVHFGVQLVLILDRFLNFSFWLSADASLFIVIVMGSFCFLDFIALGLMIQLWIFHLRLQKEGLTTYKFIVKDNQRRREEQTKQNELDRKRDSAMLKALAEKRKGDYVKLKLGGQLSKTFGIGCCDPLNDPDQSQPNEEAEDP